MSDKEKLMKIMIIKCPNLHKRNKLPCFYKDAWWHKHDCRITSGKVPCDKGAIEKSLFEELAYPKQANWL